jgi:putative transposase
LKALDVKISMVGKGRWVDNYLVERLWRSVKYEEVYLKAYGSVAEARSGIGEHLKFYNTERKHQGLGKTPDQAYFGEIAWQEAA